MQKTLKFITLIFHRYSYLFFSDDKCKQYFIFLRDIIIKISQSEFIGPRFLATYFGKTKYEYKYLQYINYFYIII